MIKSIRYFLLVSLLVSITLASAINGVGNYLLDEQVVQPFLDSQLVRMSALIEVVYQNSTANHRPLNLNLLADMHEISKSHKLIFQVWNKNGKQVLSYPHNIEISLESAPLGFSNQAIFDDDWRIYSYYSKHSKVKIAVAELYNLRRELADDIAHSNANILLITYPVFGILVWFIVSLALSSITRVTNEISNRASTFLEPVGLKEIPIEIKPLVAELNRLFIRLKSAFDRNKRFAADAAHELKTPLAALKTHAQVALNSNNDTDRLKALEKVIESVNRSSHVVTQLLTLSRLAEEEGLSDIKLLNLHKLSLEIIAYLAPHALEKNIEIELTPPPQDSTVIGNDTALGILIRNVVDNAIRYTPSGGAVKVAILTTFDKIIFQVTDTGPGIPPELRERVFERFYRVLGTKASGSGLGLAIVSQISTLHHAEISISTPPSGVGLQFDVAFPKPHA